MPAEEKISILLADDQYLTRKGLASLIAEQKEFSLIAEVSTKQELYKLALTHHPDVVIINYNDESLTLEDVTGLRNLELGVHFLAITPDQTKTRLQEAIDAGVTCHILKHCSREEILDAIKAASRGEKFFCSKVVNILMTADSSDVLSTRTSDAGCDPVQLSDRELEIIRMIAEGLTNKEVADKLFISAHTVTTHRKNVMAKLGLNNTAGLVMYAVKNRIVTPAGD